MRYPKLRELVHAIKALGRGLVGKPYTDTAFPLKKARPAAPRFRGKPEYHDELCVGCGTCALVCPGRAIELVDDPVAHQRTLTLHLDICHFWPGSGNIVT